MSRSPILLQGYNIIEHSFIKDFMDMVVGTDNFILKETTVSVFFNQHQFLVIFTEVDNKYDLWVVQI